jgi:hypothetical protein
MAEKVLLGVDAENVPEADAILPDALGSLALAESRCIPQWRGPYTRRLPAAGRIHGQSR